MEIIIKVTDEGALHLYTEALDLSFLGPTVAVQRLSDVEFNRALRQWEAIDRSTGKIIAAHGLRSKVIEAEVAYFQKMLL